MVGFNRVDDGDAWPFGRGKAASDAPSGGCPRRASANAIQIKSRIGEGRHARRALIASAPQRAAIEFNLEGGVYEAEDGF